MRYRVRLMSPGLFGTGTTGIGLDHLVYRHPDGYPIIVGARMKGAIRDSIVLNNLNLALLAKAMGAADSDGGVLWFSDAKPPDLRDRPLVRRRNHVRIGRGRTAEVGGLRTIEVVEPHPVDGSGGPTVFEGCIRLLPGRGDSDALELAETGLALIEHLGNGTNRGMGRIKVAIEPMAST